MGTDASFPSTRCTLPPDEPEMIETADVPRFRFHDIRHTFASLLLAQGESMHYVKEQMGHASIQTTVNRLDDPAGAMVMAVRGTAG